jgi:hypothetical protein
MDAQWPFSDFGIRALRGREHTEATVIGRSSTALFDQVIQQDGTGGAIDLLAVDRTIERAVDAVRDAQETWVRNELVYDPDWDEDGRLAAWQAVVKETENMPPTLAMAICSHAWNGIDPLQHLSWLGAQLSAAILRARSKTRSHLFCLNVGLRVVKSDRLRLRNLESQIIWRLNAIKAGAEWGLREHERWLTASNLLNRKLRGRRSTSRLGEVVALAVARPLISVGLVAQELKITQRAAQSLIAELDLRETTGRSRYRAWSLL